MSPTINHSNISIGFLASLLSSKLASLLLLFILLPIVYLIGIVIYNIYFHPLSTYPGPKLAAATSLWWILHTFRGDLSFQILALHEKYGDIIRVAPHEINFINPQAWKEIYGHKLNNPEHGKDPRENIDIDPSHPSIVFADRVRHGYLRKLLSNAFSDKSMQSQEHILQDYIDKLIACLQETCTNGESKPQNMVEWYNFTTFDVIGHLALYESFDCLKESNYHPWINMLLATFKWVSYLRAMKRIPYLWTVLVKFMPKSLAEKRKSARQMIREKVIRRKQRNPDYIDFMTHLLQAESKGNLDIDDLCVNAETLIFAGSETTATLLSGATYYLLTNPNVLAKLVKEVRLSFNSQEEITAAKVNGLNYMLACLDESFRMYPPAATAHERVVSSPGAMICGHFIPAGTSVGISQYAAYRASMNWSYPLEFIPERWFEQRETTFANDKREVLQPFSYGPRNCIGRNLAYMEMRLILAKLLWNFDLELKDECRNWADDQLIYTSWDKKPLMVKLTLVSR